MDRTDPQTAITSSPPLGALPEPAPAETTPVNLVPLSAPSSLSWPRSAQWTVAVLLGGVLVLLGLHAFASLRAATRPSEHLESDGPIYRLDINRAGAAELGQLEGIGPARAERIVAHRKTHGPYLRVDDLRQVHGIGPKTLAHIRRWICVEPDSSGAVEINHIEQTAVEDPVVARRSAAKPKPSSAAKLSKKKTDLLDSVININEATAAELQRLPRIGPVLSQRIIDERAKAPFRSVDELRRVKGIGPKTLAGLRPYVSIGAHP